MSKKEKIKSFDSNCAGSSSNQIFGLPFNDEEADVIVIPVPWEVTVSYHSGTANGPKAVYDASFQVDLYDPYVKEAWKKGIYMLDVPENWAKESETLRKKAIDYIDRVENGEDFTKNEELVLVRKEVDDAGRRLNKWVKEKSLEYLEKEKLVGVLGGDHSTPLGLIQALAEKYDDFGILQIDAHADLRVAYEGFEFSHASIMHNALKLPQVKKLVQVGIRDLCDSEAETIYKSQNKIITHYDHHLKQMHFQGREWSYSVAEIIKELPKNIYISFDIDGLDPKLCPNTGTPVPGGLQFEEAVYLIDQLIAKDKKIIGFDLCEVAPGKDNDWDANVGARMLYRLCNFMALSNETVY